MHLKTLRTASIGLLAVAAGCASGGAGAGAGPASASITDQAATGQVGPALLQWTGRFTGQVQHSASSFVRTRNDASGTVRLTADGARGTRAEIKLSLPQNQDPVQLYWSVSSGPCGSNSLPLMTVAQFPQISLNSGSGTLNTSLGMAFPTTGDYHVNIFGPGSDGSDESGVITCTSLTLGRRSNS